MRKGLRLSCAQPHFSFSYLFFVSISLLLLACSAPSGQFRLQGRFRSFNQGEFYIYNFYGGSSQLDTIHVSDGRFSYQAEVDDSAIYLLIFPNFSEVPVFAESGAIVKMEGDASHLKEIEITGTDENKQMTAFRLQASDMTPPQVAKAAADFIRQHPKSLVSFYLVNHYFIQSPAPDYKQAAELTALMSEALPDDYRLSQLNRQLQSLKVVGEKSRLPQFSAVDTKGRQVSNSALTSELNIITTWATWNFESQNMLRMLRTEKKKYGDRLALMSICLDPKQKECEKALARDSITWSNICDGNMWDTPVLRRLGMARVPGNLLTDRSGTVIATNMDRNKLKDKIESILK